MKTYKVEVCSNGGKYWYLNGKLHREDGPAVEGPTGGKFWYLNDKLHRTDGPAIEYAYGRKRWYIDDKQLAEADFNEKINLTVEMTIAEIEKLLGVKNLKITK